MSNEIKQGDTVRVSKDAPKIYTKDSFNLATKMDFEVVEIEDECARIENADGILTMAYVLPTKYLVKVDAEAKEAKFKVGDKVRMKDGYYKEELHGCIGTIRKIDKCHIYVEIDSTIYSATIHSIEHYTEPTAPKIKIGDRVRNIESGLIGVVDKIVYGNIVWVNGVDGKRYHWKSDELELVKPTEQTEAEKPNRTITIPVEVDLTDSYWEAYAADLAKEIVLKTVNSASDRRPSAIAEYATDIAKAVVEGLKRK